jgi:exopolysaccharide biosynthesis polyprenyl glycosylphosphotransferase
LDDPWNRLIKRLFDFSIAFFAFVFFAPLFVVVAISLKLTSEGSVFYAQERIGRDGKRFFLYKFRTMTPEAENKTGPIWAQPNDPRTTRLGRLLRRFNLDELPQLWNVLVGNMSLVGPRPERPHFVERFRDEIPRYMTRHKIKSGLTGWAQIHGLRGNTSLEERIKYDLYYMENWTIAMDIEILFATLFAYKNAY